jgi:hypothetical protein
VNDDKEGRTEFYMRESKDGDISMQIGIVHIPSERDRIAARRQARLKRQIQAFYFVAAVVVLAAIYGMDVWIAQGWGR